MPHITYDYTVPRTPPPLRTAAPAVDRPHYHHLLETSQNYPAPANSRAAKDSNATWLSLPPDDTSEQLKTTLRERHEDLGFSHPRVFQTNSTSQPRGWVWEQGEEKEKYDFQIRQVYHANTAGEEEEDEAAAIGGETELGWLLYFSFSHKSAFIDSGRSTLAYLKSRVAFPLELPEEKDG